MMDPYYIGFTMKCEDLGVTPDDLFKSASIGRILPFSAALLAKLRGLGTAINEAIPRLNVGKALLKVTPRTGIARNALKETRNVGRLLGKGQEKVVHGIDRVIPGAPGRNWRGYTANRGWAGTSDINRSLKYTGLGALLGGTAPEVIGVRLNGKTTR